MPRSGRVSLPRVCSRGGGVRKQLENISPRLFLLQAKPRDEPSHPVGRAFDAEAGCLLLLLQRCLSPGQGEGGWRRPGVAPIPLSG